MFCARSRFAIPTPCIRSSGARARAAAELSLAGLRRAPARTDLFSAVSASTARFVTEWTPVARAVVSANYFDALGPAIVLGRGLGSPTGRGTAAVLSHPRGRASSTATLQRSVAPSISTAARSRSSASPARLHRTWRLAARCLGAAHDLRGARVPARDGPSQPRETEIMVRLQPGVTVAQAESALSPFMRTSSTGRRT